MTRRELIKGILDLNTKNFENDFSASHTIAEMEKLIDKYVYQKTNTIKTRFWFFECVDVSGRKITLQIEALNAKNAEIIFKHRHPEYKYKLVS